MGSSLRLRRWHAGLGIHIVHCVYTAFAEHMRHIKEPHYMDVFTDYIKRKRATHDSNPHQYTFAGILPWLYWQMLWQHNLRSDRTIEMKLERSYLTLPEYMPEANAVQQEIMLNKTRYWGKQVDRITLEPAVYCLLNEQHAQFSLTTPDYKGARILMAFQFVVMH